MYESTYLDLLQRHLRLVKVISFPVDECPELIEPDADSKEIQFPGITELLLKVPPRSSPPVFGGKMP